MKVLSIPHLENAKGESGINTVVRKYFRYLPDFGVEFANPKDDSFDILHIHAGLTNNYPKDAKIVSSLHGLYWTADYDAPLWEYKANRSVIEATRAATTVTVPSPWVAMTLQRDMHMIPYVVPHGVDFEEWDYRGDRDNYVLAYAKNRAWADVSIPAAATELARRSRDKLFISTFAQSPVPNNMKVTGVLPAEKMRKLVQQSLVFVSPVKETFGIAALEAMAAGVPILTVDAGHVPVLAPHGVCGYSYRDGDIDDMIEGLNYCLSNRKVLGNNAREMSRSHTWQDAAMEMYRVYDATMNARPGGVSVVIPVYNKEIEQLERAIDSVLAQTRKPERVVVVDDGSSPERGGSYEQLCSGKDVDYIRQENQGVAHARNNGIATADTEFVCCLDADDRLEPGFLEACVSALERDNSLYIAYTKLRYIMPDGRTGVSQWPGEYDFDQFLKRKNQIPTCCVFRKIVWERLGGYRQRYAPTGAGSEDAEFWLRAGAMGYRGALVSEDPLFVYSQGSGHTSQNYREVDWLAWHKPWLEGKHPSASMASPKNGLSHPVNQYDKPVVSVIIPVGPGHEESFVNALDSLESQSFIKWEAVVVWDSPNPVPQWIWDAYPFVVWSIIQPKKHGAGAARNRGARLASAPLLLFLDADDWLYPEFLENVISAWNEHQSCVYTDYIGISTVMDLGELTKSLRDEMLDYDPETGRSVIYYRSANFDCARAMRQPEKGKRPYHWNNITTLVPKAWHDEVGGFDESMKSWEDLDYWWRIAQSGKCFVRIEEPLMVYRFDTGGRRVDGLQEFPELLGYLEDKYKGVEKAMGCGCSGNGSVNPVSYREQNMAGASALSQRSNGETMNDESFVMVTYLSQNRGQHPVVGQATKTQYGYRAGGEKFLVHRDDVSVQPHLFSPVKEERVVVNAPAPTTTPPPPPEPVIEEKVVEEALEEKDAEEEIDFDEMLAHYRYLDLSSLNLRKEAIQSLAKNGVTTKERALQLGMEGLSEIKWVGEATAEKILELARE